MAKFDPHRHQEQFIRWKARGCPIPDILEENRQIILNFINDMEIGTNINPSSRKGSRSFGRLRNIKSKMLTMTELLEHELGIKSLFELEYRELELLKFFNKMREGGFMCRKKPEPLKAVGIYVKMFKAFWHWHMRVERKNGKDIRDVTVELDSSTEKPKFNFFTIEDLKKLCDMANYDYRIMMMFMFDSGIRSPTELMNVRMSDLEWDSKQNHYTLSIREETSKTFGRRIKLLLCSDLLKDYITRKGYKPEDYLFRMTPRNVNQYLKNLGYKILKIGNGHEKIYKGRKFTGVKDGLSMYDFRHSSACYWLPRYKSESALKYRFGWKKSDMIVYYTEFLGMKDTIQQDDLYIDIKKTTLEKEITDKGREIETLQEDLREQNKKMQEIIAVLKALQLEKMVEQQVKL